MNTESTLNLFRRFWAGVEPGPILSVCNPQTYRQNPDVGRLVDLAVDCIRADMVSGENVLPAFSPDFGTISMPAMWGGRRIPASKGGCIHIEPISRSVEELENLGAPVPFEESDFAVALSLYRKVCDRLGAADIFLRSPDFQGPMNTLALMTEQTELIVALYDSPDLIHRLLTQITDVLIDYHRRYRAAAGKGRVIGNIWPWIVLPDDCGIAITQDFMPLLNPDLYAEFEIPQLKRIADAFGGVFIHCCGEFAQHLPTLAKADFKIHGIEVHYPCTKLWDVQAALGDSLAYVPYIAPTGLAEFPTLLPFLKSLPSHGCNLSRLIISLDNTWLPPGSLADLRAWASDARHNP